MSDWGWSPESFASVGGLVVLVFLGVSLYFAWKNSGAALTQARAASEQARAASDQAAASAREIELRTRPWVGLSGVSLSFDDAQEMS